MNIEPEISLNTHLFDNDNEASASLLPTTVSSLDIAIEADVPCDFRVLHLFIQYLPHLRHLSIRTFSGPAIQGGYIFDTCFETLPVFPSIANISGNDEQVPVSYKFSTIEGWSIGKDDDWTIDWCRMTEFKTQDYSEMGNEIHSLLKLNSMLEDITVFFYGELYNGYYFPG